MCSVIKYEMVIIFTSGHRHRDVSFHPSQQGSNYETKTKGHES